MQPFQRTEFGDYILHDRIGAGGMAEIFLATAQGIAGFEKRLVIKRILPTFSGDDQFVRMFVEEAKLCVALRHPNIVQVYDLGEIDGQYFIAMEYVDGRDLLKTLAACGKQRIGFPTDIALYIVMEVLKGLDYAHHMKRPDGQPLGIIHRDVSPSNVLLSFEGEVKIADFGIAKASTREKTETGILKGKFGYMAPEQVAGAPIDQRADIFAIGIVLYELLTGHRLFAGKNDLAVLERVRDALIEPSPRHYRPDLAPELEHIVLRALSRDPRARFQVAAELHDALYEYTFKSRATIGAPQLGKFMQGLFLCDPEEIERRQRVLLPVIKSSPDSSRRSLDGRSPFASRSATPSPDARPPGARAIVPASDTAPPKRPDTADEGPPDVTSPPQDRRSTALDTNGNDSFLGDVSSGGFDEETPLVSRAAGIRFLSGARPSDLRSQVAYIAPDECWERPSLDRGASEDTNGKDSATPLVELEEGTAGNGANEIQPRWLEPLPAREHTERTHVPLSGAIPVSDVEAIDVQTGQVLDVNVDRDFVHSESSNVAPQAPASAHPLEGITRTASPLRDMPWDRLLDGGTLDPREEVAALRKAREEDRGTDAEVKIERTPGRAVVSKTRPGRPRGSESDGALAVEAPERRPSPRSPSSLDTIVGGRNPLDTKGAGEVAWSPAEIVERTISSFDGPEQEPTREADRNEVEKTVRGESVPRIKSARASREAPPPTMELGGFESDMVTQEAARAPISGEAASLLFHRTGSDLGTMEVLDSDLPTSEVDDGVFSSFERALKEVRIERGGSGSSKSTAALHEAVESIDDHELTPERAPDSGLLALGLEHPDATEEHSVGPHTRDEESTTHAKLSLSGEAARSIARTEGSEPESVDHGQPEAAFRRATPPKRANSLRRRTPILSSASGATPRADLGGPSTRRRDENDEVTGEGRLVAEDSTQSGEMAGRSHTSTLSPVPGRRTSSRITDAVSEAQRIDQEIKEIREESIARDELTRTGHLAGTSSLVRTSAGEIGFELLDDAGKTDLSDAIGRPPGVAGAASTLGSEGERSMDHAPIHDPGADEESHPIPAITSAGRLDDSGASDLFGALSMLDSGLLELDGLGGAPSDEISHETVADPEEDGSTAPTLDAASDDDILLAPSVARALARQSMADQPELSETGLGSLTDSDEVEPRADAWSDAPEAIPPSDDPMFSDPAEDTTGSVTDAPSIEAPEEPDDPAPPIDDAVRKRESSGFEIDFSKLRRSAAAVDTHSPGSESRFARERRESARGAAFEGGIQFVDRDGPSAGDGGLASAEGTQDPEPFANSGDSIQEAVRKLELRLISDSFDLNGPGPGSPSLESERRPLSPRASPPRAAPAGIGTQSPLQRSELAPLSSATPSGKARARGGDASVPLRAAVERQRPIREFNRATGRAPAGERPVPKSALAPNTARQPSPANGKTAALPSTQMASQTPLAHSAARPQPLNKILTGVVLLATVLAVAAAVTLLLDRRRPSSIHIPPAPVETPAEELGEAHTGLAPRRDTDPPNEGDRRPAKLEEERRARSTDPTEGEGATAAADEAEAETAGTKTDGADDAKTTATRTDATDIAKPAETAGTKTGGADDAKSPSSLRGSLANLETKRPSAPTAAKEIRSSADVDRSDRKPSKKSKARKAKIARKAAPVAEAPSTSIEVACSEPVTVSILDVGKFQVASKKNIKVEPGRYLVYLIREGAKKKALTVNVIEGQIARIPCID